jgi:hypothetical protein
MGILDGFVTREVTVRSVGTIMYCDPAKSREHVIQQGLQEVYLALARKFAKYIADDRANHFELNACNCEAYIVASR